MSLKGHARVQIDITNPDGTVERITFNQVALDSGLQSPPSRITVEEQYDPPTIGVDQKLYPMHAVRREASIAIHGELVDVDGVQLTVVKEPLDAEAAWRKHRDDHLDSHGGRRRQLRKRDFLAGFKAARS